MEPPYISILRHAIIMSKNTLDKLFGSRVRVKILKNIFRNYPSDFSLIELSRKIQEPINLVKKDVASLMGLGVLKSKK